MIVPSVGVLEMSLRLSVDLLKAPKHVVSRMSRVMSSKEEEMVDKSSGVISAVHNL